MKIVTLITPFTIFIDMRPRKSLQANKIKYSKNIKKKKTIFCVTKYISHSTIFLFYQFEISLNEKLKKKKNNFTS